MAAALYFLFLFSCCYGNGRAAPTSLRYDIREEMEEGTFVGNIANNAGFNQKYSAEDMARMRFRYLSAPEVDLNLEMTTGALVTGTKIDREALCPMAVVCEVKLDVAVQPPDLFQIIKITVRIEDMNDNYPAFSRQQVSHDILESATLGTTLLLPSATDLDSPVFGIQNYELIDDHDRFMLRIQVGEG